MPESVVCVAKVPLLVLTSVVTTLIIGGVGSGIIDSPPRPLLVLTSVVTLLIIGGVVAGIDSGNIAFISAADVFLVTSGGVSIV